MSYFGKEVVRLNTDTMDIAPPMTHADTNMYYTKQKELQQLYNNSGNILKDLIATVSQGAPQQYTDQFVVFFEKGGSRYHQVPLYVTPCNKDGEYIDPQRTNYVEISFRSLSVPGKRQNEYNCFAIVWDIENRILTHPMLMYKVHSETECAYFKTHSQIIEKPRTGTNLLLYIDWIAETLEAKKCILEDDARLVGKYKTISKKDPETGFKPFSVNNSNNLPGQGCKATEDSGILFAAYRIMFSKGAKSWYEDAQYKLSEKMRGNTDNDVDKRIRIRKQLLYEFLKNWLDKFHRPTGFERPLNDLFYEFVATKKSKAMVINLYANKITVQQAFNRLIGLGKCAAAGELGRMFLITIGYEPKSEFKKDESSPNDQTVYEFFQLPILEKTYSPENDEVMSTTTKFQKFHIF